ncbi:MAG: sigma-70 family RNA polymerase sigma factor, partial [Xanthobacteraceae bacterium]
STNPETDRRWSARMSVAQSADRTAYETLLRECVTLILRVARRQGVPASRLEDVVQEVLLTVHRARQTYDPARSFVGWLSTISQRRAIDALRRHGRVDRREVHAPLAYDAHCDPAADLAPHRELAGRTKLLGSAIAELPEAQREALEHLALMEMSLDEASTMTGRTKGSLKVSLHRALKTLRARLGATE